MSWNRRTHLAAALLALLPLAACDEGLLGPDGPLTLADVAGSYEATELIATEGGDDVNWLSAGATIEMTLAKEGITVGSLFIPEGDEDGSDLEEDLTGTWTLEADTVRFSQSADTFIRDTPFVVRDGKLVGDRTFGSTRLRLVLRKD